MQDDVIKKVKRCIQEGMKISIIFPKAIGSNGKKDKCRMVKAKILKKYDNYALVQINLGAAKIKKGYMYDELQGSKEIRELLRR